MADQTSGPIQPFSPTPTPVSAYFAFIPPQVRKWLVRAAYTAVIGGAGFSTNSGMAGYESWVASRERANLAYAYLAIPVAQKNGEQLTRSMLIDCAIAEELRVRGADIKPEFATETAKCQKPPVE